MPGTLNNTGDSGLEPILCATLLRRVDVELIRLLRSLEPVEWDVPTVAPLWNVRDVAAHLLDTAVRKLSLVRDGCFVEAVEIHSAQELVDFINRINREGVTVYRRLSPAVLVSLMETVCVEFAEFHEGLDPFARAAFGVSWAGEDASLNWFDTARELTERWHHQQQIRLATNRPGIMTPELYHPVLDCFLRGLPHLYRDVDAAGGSVIEVEIAGDCGGLWFLAKEPAGWALVKHAPQEAAAHVTIPQELAWRVFTKGIDRESARTAIQTRGDAKLADKVLELTAIVG